MGKRIGVMGEELVWGDLISEVEQLEDDHQKEIYESVKILITTKSTNEARKATKLLRYYVN